MATDDTAQIDEERLGELMGQLGMYMTGAAMCLAMWMGDELGIYRALAGAGPKTADEIAQAPRGNARLTREWLDGQACGGMVAYDAAADTYAMSNEAALALADDSSPVFIARAMNAIGATYLDLEKILAAFRGDGGLAWGDHHPSLFSGTEWFFRTGYRAELPSWIEALDGTAEKLRAGGTVADVGCGHGASAVVLAQAYPEARITGFDFHAPSIETAKVRAKEASVEGSTSFTVAGAKDFEGTFDLICFFDCLHDMGDPVGIAAHAREQLADDGAILLVEPFALAERTTNMAENPMAAMMYTVSSVICTPNSLSQEVGLGLGAQAGESRLQEVFAQAGFTRFRKVAETPMNLIIEAKV
jgi:2-polyprenyl-3-methyl-5-hydroxy-6-metoxy-1,4-benzoquinol methylase